MPARFKKVLRPPITSSTYTQLIKECCIKLPDVKEYVGKCIAEFRKEAIKNNEKKNFKFTVKSETGQKLFCLKVKGGFKGLTRTKYYVNSGGIYRYDWRSKAWKVIKIIAVVVGVAAVTGLVALGILTGVGHGFGNMIEHQSNNDTPCIEYKNENENEYEDPGLVDFIPSDSDSSIEINDSEDSDDYEYDLEGDENEDEDEEEYYRVEKNDQINYVQCKYWKDLKYCYVKYNCCDNWCCCRFCHMDTINHKIDILNEYQIYCLKCSTVFKKSLAYCPVCYFEHSYMYNFRNIANRCRYLKNSTFIPVKNCCKSPICCYRCHNEEFSHNADYNIYYYCCECSNKTKIDTDYCNSCDVYLPTDKFNLNEITRRCPYFTRFYYLIIFPCCSTPYCCRKCHDRAEDHSAEHSIKKVCMHCESINTTKLNDFYCDRCSRKLYVARSI